MHALEFNAVLSRRFYLKQSHSAQKYAVVTQVIKETWPLDFHHSPVHFPWHWMGLLHRRDSVFSVSFVKNCKWYRKTRMAQIQENHESHY